MLHHFERLCLPAKLYFGIAVISVLVSFFNGYSSIQWMFGKLLWAFVWTYIIYYLCSIGYKALAWCLVLLPYILVLLGDMGIYYVTEDQRNIMRMLRLQGAWGREPMSMPDLGVKKPEDEEKKKDGFALFSKWN